MLSGISYDSLIGPAIGALGTIAAAWIGHRYRQVMGPEAKPPPPPEKEIWVPVTITGRTPRRRLPRLRRAGRRIRVLPRAVPELVVGLWRLMNRLPPARRRLRPVVAAAVGWFPFAPAAYFRTTADFLFGVALVIPTGVAANALPEPEEEAAGIHAPLWASIVLYACLLCGVLYGYLRALSSNRAIELAWIGRREAAGARPEGIPEVGTPDVRRGALERRLAELAREGWSPSRRGDFAAIVVRRPEVDHRRNAILTAVTLGLWGWVWIYRAFFRGEEREVDVDQWGTVRVAVPGSADAADGLSV